MKSITVTRNGKTYDIPEAWIAGRMLVESKDIRNKYGVLMYNMKSYGDAIDLWIEQEEMSQRLEGTI